MSRHAASKGKIYYHAQDIDTKRQHRINRTYIIFSSLEFDEVRKHDVISDVDYAVASNSIRLDDPGKDVVIGVTSTFLENNFFAVAVRFASGTGPTGIQHLNESTTFQIVDLDDTIGTMEENESNEVMFRKIWDIARDRIKGRISWCEQSPFFVIGNAF